jgi:hypothetical protein
MVEVADDMGCEVAFVEDENPFVPQLLLLTFGVEDELRGQESVPDLAVDHLVLVVAVVAAAAVVAVINIK